MTRTVVKTAEWRRIDALPRLEWPDVDLTERFRRPGGTMQLWRTQSVALYYAMTLGGLVGAIGVGEGKSVMSLLFPVAMSARSPLLIVPAALRDQTLCKVIPEMRKHWILHPNLRIMSYAELSRTTADIGHPDVIVCDEAHGLRNFRAARGRRFWDYLRSNPATRVILLSGTLTKNSLMEYYHLSMVALGEYSPLPRTYPEANTWDLALSPKRDNAYFERVDPGALLAWHPDAREGFRRRLAETPGFVVSQKSECAASITIRMHRVKMPQIQAAVTRCKAAWEDPDDRELWTGLEVFQCAAQLSQGFYYRLVEQPPAEWLEARRAYVSAVRDYMRYHRDVHSELEYRLRIKSPEKTQWLLVQKMYQIRTETVWYSDELIEWALRTADNPSIVWTAHRAFGQRMAEHVPFYDAGNSSILDEPGDRTIAASLRGHGTGKNLQMYSRLVVPFMYGGDWEQLIGRCHRHGQLADNVVVDLALHTEISERAWSNALANAHYQAETMSQRRLLIADVVEV